MPKEILGKVTYKHTEDSFQNRRLRKLHWADNWYDWANDNWVTKWDTGDVFAEDDGWLLRYDFTTAWCPPEPIYHALRDMFPDLRISWFYREDGMEMSGYL